MLMVPLLIIFGCSNDRLPQEVTAEEKRLEIVLKENPTTGYSWTMDDFDTTVLQLRRMNTVHPPQKVPLEAEERICIALLDRKKVMSL